MSMHITEDLTWVFADTEPCQVPCGGGFGCPPSCYSEPIQGFNRIPELVLDHDAAIIRVNGVVLPEVDKALDITVLDCDPNCCTMRSWTSLCMLCANAGCHDTEWIPVPDDKPIDEPISDEERHAVLYEALEHLLVHHPHSAAVDELLHAAATPLQDD